LCELRFTGARSGRSVVLPVMYARRGEQLVVLVGGADQKRWWRSFAQPIPVQVLLRGDIRSGIGHLEAVGAVGRAEAAAIYAARFPDLPVEDDPMVVIALDRSGPGSSGTAIRVGGSYSLTLTALSLLSGCPGSQRAVSARVAAPV
jgi:hypothetical protein